MAADAFRDTLPPHERHFVTRLESFGDIVVGFSMSLLALQLTIPHNAAELFGHPGRFALFFGTFMIVSVFWVAFHRIMATGFAPARVDMFFAFTYLAFVALIPYAMQVNTALSHSLPDVYTGFAFYVIVFLGVMASAFVLNVRALRRGWAYLDDGRRREAWRRLLTTVMMILVAVAALGVDLAHQIVAASLCFLGIFVAPMVVRRVSPDPRPAWLGIGGSPDGTPQPQTVS